MTEPIKQPEPLRLADDLLVMGIPADVADPAAAELRRLHGEVERLRAALEGGVEAIDWLTHHLSAHHGCLHMAPDASGIPSWVANARAALKEPK
jgi:hypothetical protein